MKNFAPVSLVAVVPNVLVTNVAQSKATSVADVIAQAKAELGKVTHASAGNGKRSIHLAGELFASMAKVDTLDVPDKESGPPSATSSADRSITCSTASPRPCRTSSLAGCARSA